MKNKVEAKALAVDEYFEVKATLDKPQQGSETASMDDQVVQEGGDMVIRDYVGTMLNLNTDPVTRIPVYHSPYTKTFYFGNTDQIISDERLVNGLWDDMSSSGAVQIKQLVRFWREKYPHGTQVRDDMRNHKKPEVKQGEMNVRVKDTAFDSVHFVDIQKITNPNVKVDNDPNHSPEVDYQAEEQWASEEVVVNQLTKTQADIVADGTLPEQLHNQFEMALDRTGFRLQRRVSYRHFRTYDIKLDKAVLYNLSASFAEIIEFLSPKFRMVADLAGFDGPVLRAGSRPCWVFRDRATGCLQVRIDLVESTIYMDVVAKALPLL